MGNHLPWAVVLHRDPERAGWLWAGPNGWHQPDKLSWKSSNPSVLPPGLLLEISQDKQEQGCDEHSHTWWAFSKANPGGSPQGKADAIDISINTEIMPVFKAFDAVFWLTNMENSLPTADFFFFLSNEMYSGHFLISFFALKNYEIFIQFLSPLSRYWICEEVLWIGFLTVQ